jgi:UPF0755 protein
MYIRRILLVTVLLGLVAAGVFSYLVYNALFSPNTRFEKATAYVYIPSDATFDDVCTLVEPLLVNSNTFRAVAKRKQYDVHFRAGKYALEKGMNNNEIINSLRSRNLPVTVSFNNQETLADLAGRIAPQIEADSTSLLLEMEDSVYLEQMGVNKETAISLYLPNSYEFYWDTSAEEFRERMLREYKQFWDSTRIAKAAAEGLNPLQATTLASIVQKETAKVNERARVAGLYLNRLRKKMPLQADPTVIYAIKRESGNFDTIIKRVLYRDLDLDSPYNTYKYGGLPPGPITMPDISAIDAVLNAEKHNFYYMVADVENFGYHKFAETLSQHNRNKVQYVRWINEQKIKR